MIQYGMRAHDLCPKLPLTEVLDTVRAHNIRHIQLAFGKSVSDYDFSTGHYSAGFAGYRRSGGRQLGTGAAGGDGLHQAGHEEG